MYAFPIIWDWMAFAVRWLHVITGIAWIGSSFYFVALDLGLRKVPNLPEGAHGEEWQVHGGGFYHIQKYLVAPERMPEHLVWFKWESYATWLSGFTMLAIVYYAGADLFLVDRHVLDVPSWVAILISLASLSVGWLLYDNLCKSKLAENPTTLMVLLFIILVAMAWGYTQVFTGRAALLHLGAFTATIMSANVFFVIIPNQKIVVADLKAGRTPDPKYGKIAKLRSTHNNYLTLPVLFLMLSNHYPLAFGTQYNWLIASLVFLMGVTIRHYFNTMHARKGEPRWTWLATVVLFILIAWLSSISAPQPEVEEEEAAELSPFEMQFASAEGFSDVTDTVMGRCSMCHASEVFWPGLHTAPKGVVLETEAQIAAHAREIYLQAGRSHAMPPGNVTDIEPSERQMIVDWYEAATRG
ncbi:MAG: urate hydroxylase PuuD [Rhodovulum sp.]|nr:urate hydroxylase PuuD [Paracoccaceae bacterium]MCC0067011.1 urate hydroxylase PuuD [Rhodovulum sp.]